jgi:arsenite-transporting ATPase
MDSAPSGHLIRLLELPESIGGWLKQFFTLLLKYRHVMRLPKISERLVFLSRKLKALRTLICDSNKTSLYAVTIPTHLALEKTLDMIANLLKLGVNCNGILINQITPESACELCRAINQREKDQISRATKVLLPGKTPTKIFLYSDSGNMAKLQALGENLYINN